MDENKKEKFLQDTKEKIKQSKEVIRKMYLDKEDPRDWVVAYSGGKDSTCVAGLVVSVIESLKEEEKIRFVHLIMSDTQMENPLVHQHMVTQCELINKYAKEKNLPISCKIVTRPIEESYMYLVLGKGYPLPYNNGKGRWCTDRLKIKPSVKAVKAINPSYILTGVRHAESQSRSRSIDKLSIDEFIGRHSQMKEAKTLNPIIYWTVEDVWKFLKWEGVPWGSTLSVRQIYRDATGECGFSNPAENKSRKIEACGARHGCWNCPVILQDKSTENMSRIHTWMKPLTVWRKLQLAVYGNYKPEKKEGIKRKERSEQLKKWKKYMEMVTAVTKAGYDRRGRYYGIGKGTLVVEARQYLLEKLLETEAEVNRLRSEQNLPPLKLITDEEIKLIKEFWEKDKKENPHVAFNHVKRSIKEIEYILEEVMKEDF